MDKITKEKLDAEIQIILPPIEVYQNNYILSHPYYFQGAPTHSSIPSKEQPPDKLSDKPTLKPTSWEDTGLIPASLPFSVEIREYLAPGNNRGWHILFTTLYNDKEYVRQIGYGVEGFDRTHDWEILKE